MKRPVCVDVQAPVGVVVERKDGTMGVELNANGRAFCGNMEIQFVDDDGVPVKAPQ